MKNNQMFSSSSPDNLDKNQNNIVKNINEKNIINDYDGDFDFELCHGYCDCWRYRGYC